MFIRSLVLSSDRRLLLGCEFVSFSKETMKFAYEFAAFSCRRFIQHRAKEFLKSINEFILCSLPTLPPEKKCTDSFRL